jgi:hypothetical protein
MRWPRESWIPLLAGLYWLLRAPEHGWLGLLLALVPGSLLLGSGAAMLLMPGDRRINHMGALGGALGVLLAVPALFAVGPLTALSLLAVSAAGFVAAGWHSLRIEPNTDEVPEPQRTLWVAAQVAVDEALLSTMLITTPLPGRRDHARVEGEVAAARELFDRAGWLEKPVDYHTTPPPLEAPTLRETRLGHIHYEHLSFPSGYEPHPQEPGRERWLSYAANRTAHAWVVLHPS